MKMSLLFVLIFFFLSCTPQKMIIQTNQSPKKDIQRITIRTVRSGNYDDPNIWDLGVVPESWDVADISDSVSVRFVHILAGLKSSRGGIIHCEKEGHLKVKPIEK